jgi:DNA-binding NarL/FixJ family response regulator
MTANGEQKKKSGGTSRNRKRILVVDDHPLMRKGIAALIGTVPDLVLCGQAGSGEETLALMKKARPDLILLDLSLSGCNGIQLLKTLREKYPAIRVLVFSMYEEGIYAERVLRAGADGYIMKKESGTRIMEAIRCVLQGEIYVSTPVALQLVKQFLKGRQASKTIDVDRLSNRELQVYTYLGNGFSSREIADRLQLSSKTVHTHREHIKRKLGLRNASDLVHHATSWVQSQSSPVTL